MNLVGIVVLVKNLKFHQNPKGLTETEYYILEKEKYLRDLRGNRI